MNDASLRKENNESFGRTRKEIFAMHNGNKLLTKVSRRSVLLQGAMCATGIATVFIVNVDSAKAAKLPQRSVGYRDTPNGDRECSNCKFFTAPDACQKVDGKISPKGYCVLWQKA
jgi:hypothetical protein